ncbi:MAG: adenosylcobinamide-GDP ribazoletransferase [Pseudomonadota bacterium]
MSAFFSALTFFSRFPVPAALARVPLVEAAAMAPLAGVLIALPGAVLLYLAAQLGASPILAASIGTVAVIIVTGALHEDGLADCADGFWGGASPERRLEIMRDSRIGTFGVLALVAAVLLKVGALQTAIAESPLRGALTLMAAAIAARAVALYPWVGLLPARADGLAVAVGRPSVRAFRKALIYGLVATLVLVAWWAPIGVILAAIAAAAVAKGCASLAQSKVGGHTGDVIGACVVLADLSYVLALTIWTV